MRRTGAGSRPPIPSWVLDVREWEYWPDAPLNERRRQWSAACDEWLTFYGYDVFDLNDAELEYRTRGAA